MTMAERILQDPARPSTDHVCSGCRWCFAVEGDALNSTPCMPAGSLDADLVYRQLCPHGLGEGARLLSYTTDLDLFLLPGEAVTKAGRSQDGRE